ncbi:MAG: chemotaxis protein CheB [Gammaproteobacteria bacterium]|nr:MAG: chemotaxis protein CheB [Gammaproteobacteria bacterium]
MDVEINIRSPKIALMNTSPRGREKVKEILKANGLEVVIAISVSEYLFSRQFSEDIDAVFIDIDEESDEDLDLLNKVLADASFPVVFSDSCNWDDFQHWGRRVSVKLFNTIQHHLVHGKAKEYDGIIVESIDLSEAIDEIDSSLQQAEDSEQNVIVLAASLGGPVAVRQYIEAINARPQACFILAQHIGEGFSEVLAAQLNKCNELITVVTAESGCRIENGTVFVAPVGERIIINPDGLMTLVRETRPSLYKPCIDFIMEEVSQRYGENSSAIIFTGMGDDGSKGCLHIVKSGGVVWAQDSATCDISSMPDCARDTGQVTYTGTPTQLAGKTMEYYGCRKIAVEE